MPPFPLPFLTRDVPFSPTEAYHLVLLSLEFSDLQGCEPGGREPTAELISQGSSSAIADKAGGEPPEARAALSALPRVGGPLLLR